VLVAGRIPGQDSTANASASKGRASPSMWGAFPCSDLCAPAHGSHPRRSIPPQPLAFKARGRRPLPPLYHTSGSRSIEAFSARLARESIRMQRMPSNSLSDGTVPARLRALCFFHTRPFEILGIQCSMVAGPTRAASFTLWRTSFGTQSRAADELFADSQVSIALQTEGAVCIGCGLPPSRGSHSACSTGRGKYLNGPAMRTGSCRRRVAAAQLRSPPSALTARACESACCSQCIISGFGSCHHIKCLLCAWRSLCDIAERANMSAGRQSAQLHGRSIYALRCGQCRRWSTTERDVMVAPGFVALHRRGAVIRGLQENSW